MVGTKVVSGELKKRQIELVQDRILAKSHLFRSFGYAKGTLGKMHEFM